MDFVWEAIDSEEIQRDDRHLSTARQAQGLILRAEWPERLDDADGY